MRLAVLHHTSSGFASAALCRSPRNDTCQVRKARWALPTKSAVDPPCKPSANSGEAPELPLAPLPPSLAVPGEPTSIHHPPFATSICCSEATWQFVDAVGPGSATVPVVRNKIRSSALANYCTRVRIERFKTQERVRCKEQNGHAADWQFNAQLYRELGLWVGIRIIWTSLHYSNRQTISIQKGCPGAGARLAVEPHTFEHDHVPA
jgi:hypothetical protein